MGIDCSCNCSPIDVKDLFPKRPKDVRSKQNTVRSSKVHRNLDKKLSSFTLTMDTNLDIIAEEEDDNDIMSQRLFLKRISIEEIEIVSDNERIQAIVSTPTLLELEDRILDVYTTEQESETDESGLDAFDMKPIPQFNQRRTSSISTMRAYKKANANEWKEAEINDLEYELKQQLLDLTKKASLHELNSLSDVYLDDHAQFIDYSDDSDEEDKLPESNLFRDGSSEKWSAIRIQKKKKEMERQIFHLASQNIASNKTKY